jgi:hypothetical protein
MFTDITPSGSRRGKSSTSRKKCPKHNRHQNRIRDDSGIQDGMSQLKWSVPSVERRRSCTCIPQRMSRSENEIKRQGNECHVGEIGEIGVDSTQLS